MQQQALPQSALVAEQGRPIFIKQTVVFASLRALGLAGDQQFDIPEGAKMGQFMAWVV